MRPLLLLLVLALPALAGCLAPHRPGTAPPTLAAGASDDCPLEPQRREHAGGGERWVVVEGCIVAEDALLPGRRPWDPDAQVQVPEGTRHLRAMLHVHGPEPARASLRPPDGSAALEGDAQGDKGRHTVVHFEVPSPAPGAWRLRGAVEERALLRGWTVTFVLQEP